MISNQGERPVQCSHDWQWSVWHYGCIINCSEIAWNSPHAITFSRLTIANKIKYFGDEQSNHSGSRYLTFNELSFSREQYLESATSIHSSNSIRSLGIPIWFLLHKKLSFERWGIYASVAITIVIPNRSHCSYRSNPYKQGHSHTHTHTHTIWACKHTLALVASDSMSLSVRSQGGTVCS